MISLVFDATSLILVVCSAFCMLRLALGPRGADRLAALSALSALVMALLVLRGATEGRVLYLDVALVYDIFGFLGVLAVASFIRDRKSEDDRT